LTLASGGYPEAYEKGHAISGLPIKEELDRKIFHAGTANKNGETVTVGGRVLCATALGNTVKEAQTQTYELAQVINWKDSFYRTDIGYRAVIPEEKTS